ncbi:MAG: hypothetical protein R6U70_11490 [Bacillota bacterium]
MEIVALVGASGTGKSQRAVIVASELGTPYVIDDGLLIANGRILAGRSAKAEKTKLAAVRTAIFYDPDHAAEVRRAIDRENPERILVLGTSDAMIHRILAALRLPAPASCLSIDDVASEGEIKAALKARKRLGQHVIPVPTLEVKKTLAGYIINPLRLLYRGGRLHRPLMIEKSLVRPPFSSLGGFFMSDRVIMQIADHVLKAAEGISAAAPPVVAMTDGRINLSVSCSVHPDVQLARTLITAQDEVRRMVEEMTSIEVASVNLYVTGVHQR